MTERNKTSVPNLDRRHFLGCGTAAGLVGGVTHAGIAAPNQTSGPTAAFTDRPNYLSAAKEAARWIRSAEITTDGGGTWRPDPDHPERTVTISLPNGFYSGSAGIILFFLELADATGDRSYGDDAKRGGDFLVRSWPATLASKASVAGFQLSFYTGLAGTAFSLAALWQATGIEAYLDAARNATQALIKAARPVGSGIEWMEACGMTGNSGILLCLLDLADMLDDPAIRSVAVKAGNRVVERAEPDARGGVRWLGMPPALLGEAENSYWPNFQLGTSGVAFALARLHAATGEAHFLEAAEQGALHLQRIATVRGDAALIHYREPDLTDLHYLGYCNGPAGTARLFQQLYKTTGKSEYALWTERLARGVMASGIPERETPGFWNVVCQCCGSAGVVDFFLGMWATTGRKDYLAFAQRVADQMLSRRSDLDGKGSRWYQAYTRVKPWEVSAETGYMIGGAGIGASLLHFHLAEAGRYRLIRLPDNPFNTTSGRRPI